MAGFYDPITGVYTEVDEATGMPIQSAPVPPPPGPAQQPTATYQPPPPEYAPVEPGMYTSPYVQPGTQAPHYDPYPAWQGESSIQARRENQLENDTQIYQANPAALQPSTNHDPVLEWLGTNNPFGTKTTELAQKTPLIPATATRSFSPGWKLGIGRGPLSLEGEFPREGMSRQVILEMMNQASSNPSIGSATPQHITPTSSADYWKEMIAGDPRGYRQFSDTITRPFFGSGASANEVRTSRIGRPLKGLFGGGQR